jgi:hypothetical protein
MSEINRELLVGKETEVSVSEAIVRVDEVIGLLERCGEAWNRQFGLLDDTRALKDRLAKLLVVLEGCRQRIDTNKSEADS